MIEVILKKQNKKKTKRGHAIFLGGHVRVEEVRDGRFILKYGTIPCFKGTGGVASWVLRLRCFRRLFVSQEEAVVPPLDILAEQNLHSCFGSSLRVESISAVCR